MPAAEPLKILLYDPDTDVRVSLQDILECEGYAVEATAQLSEALAVAQRADVALAVVDLLPTLAREASGMDEVVRLARHVKVGLVSTSAEVLQTRGTALPAVFTLQKPFEMEPMLAAVARHTERRPVPAPAEQLVRAYFHALSTRDFESLRGVCTESVRYHLPGNDPGFARTIEGRHAFIPFARETFSRFEDAQFQVEAVYATPESVVARYRGTWGPPNARQELPGAVIFRLRNERIDEIGIRTDVRGLGR